jgi:adenylate kinase family enzyme
VRAQLGNPKITFVTGAPGSGKGTQCEKLVEEFGYTHISVGDVIRREIKKGTRDGDRLKQFVDQGKNAPLELTCQLLINALIA